MSASSLPKNYTHLIPDLRMPVNVPLDTRGAPSTTTLRDLLTGVPFERPIQTFTEDTLRAAFALAPVTSIPRITVVTHPTPPLPEDNDDNDDDASGVKKDKKRKKKLEADQLQLQQQQLLRLARTLRNLTFEKWQVQGQASSPFLQRITRENCASLGVPNYFDFITTPMDLSTMYLNAERGLYSSLEAFRRDLYLVVDNAKTFNRKGEDVYDMAIELGTTYERFVVQEQVGATTTGGGSTTSSSLAKKKKKKKDKK